MTRMKRGMLAMALLLGACHRHDDAAGAADGSKAANAAEAPVAAPSPATTNESASAAPQAPPTLADAATFAPLASDQVKDAIHRALRTGQTQRWQDGELSGYAVPSTTTDAHGCRAVRYTVDQLRDVPPKSINACEG
jgi:post-segregation antitoxin (ccd killing protein)